MYFGRWMTATLVFPSWSRLRRTPPAAAISGFPSPRSKSSRATAGAYGSASGTSPGEEDKGARASRCRGFQALLRPPRERPPGEVGGCARSRHRPQHHPSGPRRDRKSTRLNSSNTVISYAVFCSKKKKKKKNIKKIKKKKKKKKKQNRTK